MPMESGVDSGDLAAEAAAAAVNAIKSEGQPEFVNPQQHANVKKLDDIQTSTEMVSGVEGEFEVIDPEPVTPDPKPFVAPEQITLDEVAMALQNAGIDLGISRADLPESLHQAYDNLTNQALIAAAEYENRVTQLQTSQAEMQQFAQSLQDDPAKVLLTLAVTNPDAFTNAVNQFEEMQQDERYKNMVLRELKAEATLKAAQRAQMVQQQNQQMTRVQVLTKATHSAAQRYGVDAGVAEEVVAMAIRAAGGNIDAATIPQIVSRLRPTAPTQIVATPAKMAAVATAPTTSVNGQGTAPRTAPGINDEASYGLTKSSQNPLIDLVKDASRRASAAMRGE